MRFREKFYFQEKLASVALGRGGAGLEGPGEKREKQLARRDAVWRVASDGVGPGVGSVLFLPGPERRSA